MSQTIEIRESCVARVTRQSCQSGSRVSHTVTRQSRQSHTIKRAFAKLVQCIVVLSYCKQSGQRKAVLLSIISGRPMQ